MGVGHGDGEEQAVFLADKIANLRIFEDEQGKTNLSILDVKGAALVVSQFTLYADTRKGCRPSFTDAALPEQAAPLVGRFADLLRQSADPGGRLLYEPDGSLLFADTSNQIIRRIDADGNVHRVAGVAPVEGVAQAGFDGDGGPALQAHLHNPVDLARDDDGTLYFTDVYNHCVRAIDPDGTIRTAVGVCGQPGYEGDGGPAGEALLKRPYGIEWADGILYVSDTGNNVIRAVRLR